MCATVVIHLSRCDFSVFEKVAEITKMKLELKAGGYLAFVSSRKADFRETDNPLCPFTSKDRQTLMYQMVWQRGNSGLLERCSDRR